MILKYVYRGKVVKFGWIKINFLIDRLIIYYCIRGKNSFNLSDKYMS